MAVQTTGVQGVTVLNKPVGKHVAVPPPLKPVRQVTSTACPVVPAMEPAAARSEFGTAVLVQGFGVQVTALNKPLGWHVAGPPPL